MRFCCVKTVDLVKTEEGINLKVLGFGTCVSLHISAPNPSYQGSNRKKNWCANMARFHEIAPINLYNQYR